MNEIILMAIWFDMDTQINHVYQPYFEMRFNRANKEFPIHAIVRCKWTINEYNYPLNEKFKKNMQETPTSTGVLLAKESLYLFDLPFSPSNVYLSEAGLLIGFCKDFDVVVKEFWK